MSPTLAPTPVTRPSLRAWLVSDGGFHAKLLLSTLAGVLMIGTLAGVFLLYMLREREHSQLRNSTFEVFRKIDRVGDELRLLEAAHHEYLLSPGGDRLNRFEKRKASTQARLAELTELMAGKPEFTSDITQIGESLLVWELRVARPLIARRRAGGMIEDLPLEPQGQGMIDGIHEALAQLARRETDASESTRQRAAIERRWQGAGFGALSLVAIGFVISSSRYGYRAYRRHFDKVENAEARLRLIVDHTLDGLLMADASGGIRLANPAAERIFGAPAAEILGRHISELMPRSVDEPLESLGRGVIEAEARRLDRPENIFPVEISLSDMVVDGQRHYVALVRDITERRRNEEALRLIGLGVSSATGEEFVQTLVARLSQALKVDCAFIVELEREGHDTIHIMTRAEKGETCGCGPCDLSGTACEEVLRSGFRAYLSGVQDRFPCDWLVASFGAESFVCMPLVDHRGDVIGLLGVLDHRELERVDVVESTLQIFAARAAAEVERKRSERSLASEKERLAVTLSSIGDGCITVDRAGFIVLFNPVAERLTGWPAATAIGTALGEIVNLANVTTRRPLRRALEALVTSGQTKDLAGATLITALDATERVVEINASPIADPRGNTTGTVLVLRDATERHRSMEERQKAEKLESLGVAAGGIAHDFNNLLTAILGNLSLVLSCGKIEESVGDRLTAAKRASLRAQELAQQLLTFAKGGAPIKQTASIAQLVRDTVTFHLRGSRVACEFHIPDGLWRSDVDAGQISQVLQNLSLNADQAMPAGGTLRVSCANIELGTGSGRLGLAPGRWIKITVQDEGIGIAEEHLKKIFDPYFTTKPKGSGLGLATSYSIVKAHGGAIDVVSQPGEGTVFYLFLPASDKPAATAEETLAPAPAAVQHARVLVLDDEEAICALVQCALEPLGYEVVVALDANTAIQLYEAAFNSGERFDLVVSDLTIPGGMGGQAAVRRIHEIDPTARAIVSSGYAMDPVMSSFREHGFLAMIAKPYEIEALARVVAEVLAQPEPEKVIRHDFAAA
ncbi:MAG: PAS domain S-box protein [Chthoniobacteraceae bacterium]